MRFKRFRLKNFLPARGYDQGCASINLIDMKSLFLAVGLFTFFPVGAEANCPVGVATARSQGFTIQFGNFVNGSDMRQCEVGLDRAIYEPMEVVGCFPNSEFPEFLQLKAPAGWNHKCFKSPPENFLVPAKQFLVTDPSRVSAFRKGSLMPRPLPGPMVREVEPDCPPEIVPVASKAVRESKSPPSDGAINSDYYIGRKDPLFLLLNDLMAQENKLKSVEGLEKYHSCLLSQPWEKKQNQVYKDKYRHVMQHAATSFSVPLPLLTCLCGRESRFKTDAVSSTSVKGLCQTTARTLKDVEKWRREIPEVKQAWAGFVDRLDSTLEHKDCATAKITSETIARCPSLGFGAASIYLLYANARVEKNERFKNVSWQTHDLESLITISAAYNVGVELTDKALTDVNKQKWQRTLLNSTCSQFSKDKKRAKSKFKELKEHMIALRSCLQEDNWLDHQGKPLKAECKMSEAMEKHQLARLAKFEGSIPTECGN